MVERRRRPTTTKSGEDDKSIEGGRDKNTFKAEGRMQPGRLVSLLFIGFWFGWRQESEPNGKSKSDFFILKFELALFLELQFEIRLFLRLCSISFIFPGLSVVRLVARFRELYLLLPLMRVTGPFPDTLLIVTAHTKTLRGV